MLLQPLREQIERMGLQGAAPEDIASLFDDDTIAAMLAQAEAEAEDERFGKFRHLFPDLKDCPFIDVRGNRFKQVGESRYYARDYYQRHMDFFEAGASFRARCLMAANRIGKTYSAGGFEMACHLTGRYPHWWPGRRFLHPVRAWACGKTNETTRDIVQVTLLGDVVFEGARKVVDGSGVIPRELVGTGNGQITWKQGVADLVDTIRIKHMSGGWSKLGLKSYQQGRGSFEGTAQHVVWDDEEPPMEVYGEQVIRTATTKGIIYLTFTPLAGVSEVVQQFINEEQGGAS